MELPESAVILVLPPPIFASILSIKEVANEGVEPGSAFFFLLSTSLDP